MDTGPNKVEAGRARAGGSEDFGGLGTGLPNFSAPETGSPSSDGEIVANLGWSPLAPLAAARVARPWLTVITGPGENEGLTDSILWVNREWRTRGEREAGLDSKGGGCPPRPPAFF